MRRSLLAARFWARHPGRHRARRSSRRRGRPSRSGWSCRSPPAAPATSWARIVVDQLSQQLGQPIIVENRPGAGNTIGMSAVAKAEPDGHTLLVNSSTHTVTPATRSNLGFEMSDLAADRAARQHAGGDAVQSLEGLQDARRFRRLRQGQSRQGQLRLGGRRQFLPSQRRAFPPGGRLRGGAPAVQGRAGGDDRGDGGPRRLLFRAAGQCAAAAARTASSWRSPCRGSSRASALPDVPTTVQAGFPNSEYNFWAGMFAPAKTPAAIREKLYAEMTKALANPAVAREAQEPGRRPDVAQLGAQFDALVKQEIETNTALVKAAGIKVN